MDQRTRKLIVMHKALHPRDDIYRRYVSREEREEKDLASIEDSVETSIQQLEDNIENQRTRAVYSHQKKILKTL